MSLTLILSSSSASFPSSSVFFLQLNNPVREMEKMKQGQREAVFEDAVLGLLGPADTARHADNVNAPPPAPKRTFAAGAASYATKEGSGDGGGEDEDEDRRGSDSDSDASWTTTLDDGKYHRRLPDQSDSAAREAAKAERKIEKAAFKEAAAEKRKSKIKKHVKKRAVKNCGSKNKK